LGTLMTRFSASDRRVGGSVPQIRERFRREAAEPVGNGPAEFSAFVRMEVARRSYVARRTSLEPEGGSWPA